MLGLIKWRSINKTFDLNSFDWFFWGSPLDRILKPKKVFSYDKVELNESWIMPNIIPEQTQNWLKNTCKYPPEGLYNNIGFFVRRKHNREYKYRCKHNREYKYRCKHNDISHEVLRFRYGEVGNAWFYKLRGSGIFLISPKHKVSVTNCLKTC